MRPLAATGWVWVLHMLRVCHRLSCLLAAIRGALRSHTGGQVKQILGYILVECVAGHALRREGMQVTRSGCSHTESNIAVTAHTCVKPALPTPHLCECVPTHAWPASQGGQL